MPSVVPLTRAAREVRAALEAELRKTMLVEVRRRRQVRRAAIVEPRAVVGRQIGDAARVHVMGVAVIVHRREREIFEVARQKREARAGRRRRFGRAHLWSEHVACAKVAVRKLGDDFCSQR